MVEKVPLLDIENETGRINLFDYLKKDIYRLTNQSHSEESKSVEHNRHSETMQIAD